MVPEDVRQLDEEWERERVRYLASAWGVLHEPMPPRDALGLALLFAAFLGLFVLYPLFVNRDPSRVSPLVVAFFGIPTAYHLFALVHSLRYERARAAYLRRRAAAKARHGPEPGVGPGPAGAYPPFTAARLGPFAPACAYLVHADGAALRCVPVEKGFRVSAPVLALAAELNYPPARLGSALTFPVEGVASATLEPLSPWAGPGVAAWRLRLEDGKTYSFRIRSVEELDFAAVTLAGVLGDRFEDRLATG